MAIRGDTLEQDNYKISHVLRVVNRQYTIYTRNKYLNYLVIKEGISNRSSHLERPRIQMLNNTGHEIGNPAVKL